MNTNIFLCSIFLFTFSCSEGKVSDSNTANTTIDDTEESTDTDADSTEEEWGQAALDYLSEKLGTYDGEWQLYNLDGNDEAQSSWFWTDVITSSNLRIEEDRAIMDVFDVMTMADGSIYEMSFYEGVYILDDGSAGDYFMDIDGVVSIMIEIEPGLWQYQTELTMQDYANMLNVSSSNVIDGWKTSTKIVSMVGGQERHDVSVLTHVEYENESGEQVAVEYTSMVGFHQKQAN